MDKFNAFSPLHGFVLLVIALFTAIAIVNRRHRAPYCKPVGPFERSYAIAYLMFWIGTFVWLRIGPLYDPPTTYPLQLCHWCGVFASLVLLTGHRPLRAILYFCGIGLCTQALFTPLLVEGPALFPFWFFWITHGTVIGVALYDVIARGYRPTVRDYGIACLTAFTYVVIVLPIDLATGWNYGFVGPGKPDVPSIVDLLGPWPERLLAIALISAAVMGALLLPWLAARSFTAYRSQSAHR